MNINIDDLIDRVFARPALWIEKPKHHHNRDLDILWDEVATELHTSRIFARNKWRVLCERFRSSLELEDPEWKYFHSLRFLKEQFMPRAEEPIENEEVTDRFSPESPNYDIEFPPLSSSPLPTEEDEDLNFFKSLLPHIRNLSPFDKMDYRIKIMKLTQEFLTSGQNISH
nr:unnamed protein product [Callosobruchus chinensis]